MESVDQRQNTSKSVPKTFRNPPWWNRRTRLERTLCFVSVISIFMIFVMASTLAIYGYLYHKNKVPQQSSFFPFSTESQVSNDAICVAPECVISAAEILLNVDDTVDPCDDFYHFACGGWINRQNIPEDRSSISSFSKVQDDVDLKLRDFLEKNLTGLEPKFIKMLKWMYDSCMDIESIENFGADPLKNDLKSLGGWPVVEGSKWEESNFDWIDMLKDFRKLGYSSDILLSLSVTVDERNNTVHIINIDDPLLGVPDRSYLIDGLNDTTTSAYFKLMIKSAMLLGVDETTARNELLKALHFETDLAKFSLPVEEKRNVSKLYNKYTIAKLQQEVPQIPWLKYFNSLLNDEIYENETLIVTVPEFLPKFADLIASTEKRIVANYMLWRVVDQSSSLLSKDWRDLVLEYTYAISGKTQDEPRWEYCLSSLTYSSLGIALSSYYVRQYFREESKDAVLELVKYIHSEFLNILEDIDWMGEQTKKQAKEKANAMRIYIGYPKELFNNTAILEYYENLTITTENYFENWKRLNKFYKDYEFSKLRKPYIKGEWTDHADATTVNAYAFFTENAIEFPAAIFRNPFFSKDRPRYLNFGGMGSTIGHEITHGFDDSGRQYDKDGNNVNWWDETTDELYNKKAQCIIDLYNNYTVNGLNINGVNTQGENIADFGGMKEAYRAYQSWVKDHREEQLLPGLKFTQNQMFWISTAHVFCEKYRPESLKLSIRTEEHSPAQFRINGPMSNIPEFSKDFKCPLGSQMNKKERCEVW